MQSKTKLAEFRKSKKLLQKEMYDKLKVSRSYYEKLESGNKQAGRKFIEKMIKEFPNDEILKIFF
jgi:transcriptional regulator with XRE-family HTH domain